jgi:hypothetical protein
VHYGQVNEEMDFHITEKLTSLSALGSIFENFWEPMSIGVKVILLVGYYETMYTRINEKIDSHIIENRRAFRRLVPFLKIFWREPMSVNVRVVLLVGYDKTLFIPCRVWNSLGLSGLQRVWTTWLSYPFIKQ